MNTISSISSLLSKSVSVSNNNASISIFKSFSYGLYDYYVFSSDTSFTCNSTGTVDFIMIGGGGAGGGNHAGGGGAGGVASGSMNLESGTTYAVKVGAGGTGGGAVGTTYVYTAAINNGGNSSIIGGSVNVIAYGGGYGGGGNNGYAYNNGIAGNTGFTTLGSGGGGMSYNYPMGTSIDTRAGVGGNGVNNTVYGSAGTNGGAGYLQSVAGNGGGGGGAGSAGGNASGGLGGNGGNGLSSTVLTWLPNLNATGYMTSLVSTWSTSTTNGTYIAGGGGGGSWAQNGWQPGTGGLGGGGAGGANGSGAGLAGSNGARYTGSGGGGGASTGNVGGSGGSGLVVIRVLSSTEKIINQLSTAAYNAMVYKGTTLQAGAFGLKLLLDSALQNPVIQIKAGTGGTPTDFYAPNDGTTNLTTGVNGTGTGIVAHLNGAVGYVTKWYDQTGNGHHGTAATYGSTLPFYDISNGVVDFGTSGYFSLADSSFPSGNASYSYIYKQGRIPSGINVDVWSGGTPGTFGRMGILLLSGGVYNDTWYGYDFYGMTPIANTVVAATYGGAGSNTGDGGKKFYISNVLQTPTGITSSTGGRQQTTDNCYLGAPHPNEYAGGYRTYNSTMPYFYWMPYPLGSSDRFILGNT